MTSRLPTSPAPARRELAGFLAGNRWPGDVDGVLLAVHEAVVNAERHGRGVARVEATLFGSTLQVEICDHGNGFSLPPVPEPSHPLAESGRGLWLIGQVASGWEVRRSDGLACLILRFDA